MFVDVILVDSDSSSSRRTLKHRGGKDDGNEEEGLESDVYAN